MDGRGRALRWYRWVSRSHHRHDEHRDNVERYAFLVVTYGLVLSLVGTGVFRRIWAPLALLIFMIPLPEYFTGALTLDLQLSPRNWAWR